MPRGAVGCLDDSHALSPLKPVDQFSPFKPLSHRSATLSSDPPRGILHTEASSHDAGRCG
jgi:hypothetical protein